MNDRVFEGTRVKYLVQIESSGFSMETDDFNITIRRGKNERTFQKSELVEETVIQDGEEHKNYYLCFDTSEFGTGMAECIIRAYAPDTDFEDGFRTEVDKFKLLITDPA